MTHTWNPSRYLAHADERGRPFVDLLARIGAEAPGRVVDLGCGPGNLTSLLADRWPAASIVGVDSSAEMIAAASDSRIDFRVGDLREWVSSGSTTGGGASSGSPFDRLRTQRQARAPGRPVDVLISNATLQWLPDHLDLLPDLVRAVAPGGWLAFQVPANFDEPSHTIRADLAAEAPYAAHTAGVAVPGSHDAATYLSALAELGCTVDAWETTYLHVLTGTDPVFSWVSGTGARPTLQALPDDLRPAFTDEFKRRLRAAYPPQSYGVVLPFRRVFVVAQVPDQVSLRQAQDTATGSTSGAVETNEEEA